MFSSIQPVGAIMISDTKTNGFDLKMMGKLFHGRTNFTTIKRTMDIKMNWDPIKEKNAKFFGKKITLNGLKYHYGLYADRDVTLNDYMHALVNSTYKLSEVVSS